MFPQFYFFFAMLLNFSWVHFALIVPVNPAVTKTKSALYQPSINGSSASGSLPGYYVPFYLWQSNIVYHYCFRLSMFFEWIEPHINVLMGICLVVHASFPQAEFSEIPPNRPQLQENKVSYPLNTIPFTVNRRLNSIDKFASLPSTVVSSDTLKENVHPNIGKNVTNEKCEC